MPVMRSGISNQQALLEVQMMKWNLTVAKDGIAGPSGMTTNWIARCQSAWKMGPRDWSFLPALSTHSLTVCLYLTHSTQH